jgi:hypothetical protein
MEWSYMKTASRNGICLFREFMHLRSMKGMHADHDLNLWPRNQGNYKAESLNRDLGKP